MLLAVRFIIFIHFTENCLGLSSPVIFRLVLTLFSSRPRCSDGVFSSHCINCNLGVNDRGQCVPVSRLRALYVDLELSFSIHLVIPPSASFLVSFFPHTLPCFSFKKFLLRDHT